MTISPRQKDELRDFISHPGWAIFLGLTEEALESAKETAFKVAVSSSDVAAIKLEAGVAEGLRRAVQIYGKVVEDATSPNE